MPGFKTQSIGGALTNQTLQSLQLMSTMSFPTQGNVWFVAPRTGSDTNNSGTTPDSAFATLRQALSMATANQNDIVYLLGQGNTASNTTDYLSANLDWNKNGVHLIGVNAGPMLGQRSRVSCLSTATSFANLFTVSANGCLIKNVEFYQGTGSTNPTAASTCLTVTGQRNVFQNCQISGIGDANLDDTGSNSLTLSGSENLFQHCYIGLDTIIRATAVSEVFITGGARNIFEDCMFASYTSGSTFKAVTFSTPCDRFIRFVNCTFYTAESITSAVAPTGAIGGTTMNGQVQVINPSVFGYALLATGGNTSVKVVTFQAATTVQGIGASAAAS